MKLIDLHAHSNLSDGSLAPTALLRRAAAQGVAAVALTDHDTIAGLEEARQEAVQVGVAFLPGMELSVQYKERQLHIVALGFDVKNAAFRQLYQKIRAFKEKGMEEVVEEMRRLGADISLEKIKPFVKAGALDRYAIMRYFVSLALFDDVQKIWDTYINPVIGKDDETIAVEAAIHGIKAAGGVTSLAHFHKRLGLAGLDRSEQEAALAELMRMGMDGMELYYPNYSADDQVFAAAMVEKYRMLPTGGTDFHGANRPKIELGTGQQGNIAVPYALYEAVVKRCGSFNRG